MLMLSRENAAKLEYGPGNFRVLRPGTHVYCAVTGEPIALEDLRYWSVERQEAYASCEIAAKRMTQRT